MLGQPTAVVSLQAVRQLELWSYFQKALRRYVDVAVNQISGALPRSCASCSCLIECLRTLSTRLPRNQKFAQFCVCVCVSSSGRRWISLSKPESFRPDRGSQNAQKRSRFRDAHKHRPNNVATLTASNLPTCSGLLTVDIYVTTRLNTRLLSHNYRLSLPFATPPSVCGLSNEWAGLTGWRQGEEVAVNSCQIK